MRPILERSIRPRHNTFDLVPTSPLGVTRVPVDPPHILPNLRFNRFQEEVVDGIHRIGEYQL